MPSLSLFSIETIICSSSYKSKGFSPHPWVFCRWLDVPVAVLNTKGAHEIYATSAFLLYSSLGGKVYGENPRDESQPKAWNLE